MWHKGHHPSTTKDVNRTYVISACKNTTGSLMTHKTETTLKLQRRETNFKECRSVEKQVDKDEHERRLTLQRRPKTGLLEKDNVDTNSGTCVKVRPPLDKLDVKPALSQNNTLVKSTNHTPDLKMRTHNGINGRPFNLKPPVNGIKAHTPHVSGSLEDIKSHPGNNLKGQEPCSSFSVTRQDKAKTPVGKSKTLEKPKTPKSGASNLLRSVSVKEQRSPAVTPKRPPVSISDATRKIPISTGQKGKTEETSVLPEPLQVKDEAPSSPPGVDDGSHKEENCAVTVAVRVRPFSSRERTENDPQVVFMKGQETFVQPPDSRQNHSFLFDFSFWSFDESDPTFAGQETVYEKLVVPLLERSLLGYNTCLFAYGQTGSGKSYTMMGFDEEVGIIPRFCQHLFSRIQATKSQVTFHLEMSYFEVYNEKIHDLLVFKADNGQKKQPLRVREHPLLGPYVEELSANVVSSFQDIESWLELGNKQRATAATGMNDKSSRSHSVFTIIMTQTKTELVDGEEHDHRITSRINFLDLAGSERCTSAKTTGDRLKEGISINKSLLTLGKVISALSEGSQMKKKVFIPYRESVLTWLLKDSLGGNSKTAMIATISPALGNIEETLSTLRYAKQACLIINIAKVNEDMNAKLIRELKLEVEKLKAAQLSAKNMDSEKFRHCQQEITSLKLKLGQQEKEMSELHRIWKERLEQAEQRKKEETKELQKAGITFKMDNRLPNLVNLNEDPQLSEMLLYMIKEGRTTVGKYQAGASHDIQLSGALIAEDHCVITNIHNTVRITPTGDAKTFVNGLEISSSTILHHGDRVILGGDHYFRFNHPVEVQQLKGQPRTSTLTSERPKDFDFAKNELLTAQRAKLEEEIEEARLKAKEEMMQGIQIAKEMAQQELSSQRSAYEEKIKALEAELLEETRKKQHQEITSKKAACKIQELEVAKVQLQHEIHVNKRRLEMETLATKQALEDHTVRHARILQALEDEKKKIEKEVQMLQQEKQQSRERSMSVPPSWNSLKLSVMIQEANTISAKLHKHTVFSRHEASDKENLPCNSVQIQVQNLKLGIVTFWSLDKFEYKLAAMKDLYENNSLKEDDVFYDPNDEWEPDISKSSLSNLSRRRSKSLLRNKRISGCLYEIRVHPIQSLQSGHSSGLMNKSSSFLSKSSSVCSNGHDSHIPDICKDLIGGALEYLGQRHANESTVADSLISCLGIVCKGVDSVSQAYEQQDEDSTEALFVVSRDAQAYSVQLTSAFQQLVVLIKYWLDSFAENQKTSSPADNLLLNIKKLGGYLQLFLQGCSSDITAMVTEAKGKIGVTVEQVLQSIGHLAALTGCDFHLQREDCINSPLLQGKSLMEILNLGVCYGLKSLTECILNTSRVMQSEILRCSLNDQVHAEIKNTSSKIAEFLYKCLAETKKINMDLLLRDSASSIRTPLSSGLHNLNTCLNLLQRAVVSILNDTVTDAYTDISQIHTLLNDIASSASSINKVFLSLSQHVINLAELERLSEALLCAIKKKDFGRSHPHLQSLDALRNHAFSPTAIQWV
ncbi:kinesin-like protein KIF14 [Gastrophryne carolinensis]